MTTDTINMASEVSAAGADAVVENRPHGKGDRAVGGHWRAVAVVGAAVVVVSGCRGGVHHAGAAHSVQSSKSATLLVNDTSAVGTVGDNHLSLEEAIGLANGSLALGKLSKAERAQVHGTPGPGTPDLIKVALPRGTVISAQAALSVIRGNTDDTIDGNGATLSGGRTGTALTLQLRLHGQRPDHQGLPDGRGRRSGRQVIA
jgi:hypothetical protein